MNEINIYEKDSFGNNVLFDIIVFSHTPDVGEKIFCQDKWYIVQERWYLSQLGTATTNIVIEEF